MREGYESFKKVFLSEKYDIVIVDEILGILRYDLIFIEEIKFLIKNKFEIIEFVLIGRNVLDEFIEMVDLVIEMREVKYYF